MSKRWARSAFGIGPGVVLLVGSLLTSSLLTGRAQAEIPMDHLQAALESLPDHGERFLRTYGAGSKAHRNLPHATVPFLLRLDEDRKAPRDALPLGGNLYTIWAGADDFSSLAPIGDLSLSPIRHLQLSLAEPRVQADHAKQDYGLRGTGSIVGILDSGVDLFHPALRKSDGGTRVLWMLSYGQSPRGTHPELEESYGCSLDDPCAVYSQDEIDLILEEDNQRLLPADEIGHGTHIASIAAGRDDDYPGIAPDADLVIVGAADETGGVFDSRILTGAKFIFDRAGENNQPAVINVSLGSNFGSHRGDSTLEQGLAALARGPGRAVVVAAGNSGDRYNGILPGEFGEFGAHAEYVVTEAADVRVPILQYASRSRTITGGIYVWIATYPGQTLEVALVAGQKDRLTQWVGPGESGATRSEDFGDSDAFDMVVLNGTASETNLEIPEENIVVAILGDFAADRRFELVLRGAATARLWSSGTGEASPGLVGAGPLLARARSLGTIQIPATHEDLIAVGATVNRDSWTDIEGNELGFAPQGQGVASFSSKGPNQLGVLKPDLVAPGDGIIAAMAQAADPRGRPTSNSQFNAAGTCPSGDACFVIDEEHGIASGTSMAAPFVTGAIALLMQREPDLQMTQAKRYLMAGAFPVGASGKAGGWGTGELDVVGALLAQDAAQTEAADPQDAPIVDPQRSYVVWGDSFIHPLPAPPLQGMLLVRDADGAPRPVRVDEVEVNVRGPGSVQVEEGGPGMFSLQASGESDGAGQELEVEILVSGARVQSERLRIELDPVRLDAGYALVGGTCSWTHKPGNALPSAVLVLLGISALSTVRRRRSRTA